VIWDKIEGRQGKEKTEALVNKRMWTISTDWKNMSAAVAQAAIRHGVSTRNSDFHSALSIRPPA